MKETILQGKLPVVVCRACKTTFAYSEDLPYKCPMCNTFNSLSHGETDAPAAAKPELVPIAETSIGKTTPRMLGDVVVEPFDPYATGVATWDATVGGLAKAFVVFVAGGKGVGKTTLATNLSILHCVKDIGAHMGAKVWTPDRFEVDDDRRVFYGSAEEPLQRYLLRLWRLGYLKFDPVKLKQQLPFSQCVIETPETRVFIEILKTRFMGYRNDEIIDVLDKARRFKPTFLWLDSIRKYKHRDVKGTSPLSHGPAVVEEIIDFAEETGCCCLGIKRLTKAGLVAGNEDEGYDVDAVAHLDRVKNGMKRRLAAQGLSGRIVKLSLEKNRLGDDEKKGLFVLGEQGMLSVDRKGTVLGPLPPPKEGMPCPRPPRPAAPRKPPRKRSRPNTTSKRRPSRTPRRRS